MPMAWVVTALLLSTSASSFADDLPDLGESARAELSPQLERKVGERIMNEIRLREPSYIDDPEINDYLNRLGRRLVEASDNPTGAPYMRSCQMLDDGTTSPWIRYSTIRRRRTVKRTCSGLISSICDGRPSASREWITPTLLP